jgi:hypothetical protein
MVKRLLQARLWMGAGLCLLVAVAPMCVLPVAQAQDTVPLAPGQSRTVQPQKTKERSLPGRYPDKPSQPPAFTLPVAPLGFTAPGAIYLGQRNSLASLDFLDENRLLFTFRVPGLIHRESADSDETDERQIRAVVLVLPAGTVEAEALWSVHDRTRYLWMLKDGHFLLRDRDGLSLGDAALELKPFLRFPGPLLWLEMDPTQQFLVTDSREPEGTATRLDDVSSPAGAEASTIVDGQKTAGQPDMVLRILRRDSGQVMLVSHVRSTVHLPINSEGYLESLRANGVQWLVNLKYFSGGSRILGRVDSTCSPTLDFISQRELLVNACGSSGGHKLVAMATNGRRLWEDSPSVVLIWPLVVMGPDGSRLARETLAVDHPISASSPLNSEEIKGQLVEVLDAANGKVALEAPASPALDAGGNVAISPSGRRVAVLNAGTIQVFELPAPPPVPEPAGNQLGR